MADESSQPVKSFLHISPSGEDKGCWTAMAGLRGEKLEAWVIRNLNAAVQPTVRAEVRRRFKERNEKNLPPG